MSLRFSRFFFLILISYVHPPHPPPQPASSPFLGKSLSSQPRFSMCFLLDGLTTVHSIDQVGRPILLSSFLKVVGNKTITVHATQSFSSK